MRPVMTPNAFRAFLAVLLTVFVVGGFMLGFRLAENQRQDAENDRYFSDVDAHDNLLIIDSRTGKVEKHYKD